MFESRRGSINVGNQAYLDQLSDVARFSTFSKFRRSNPMLSGKNLE